MLIRMRQPSASYIAQVVYSKITGFIKKRHESCTKHLDEAGESYLQHLWFTCRMSVRFVAIAIVLVIHGLIPYLFTRTASTQTEKIFRIMKTRRPSYGKSAEWEEYDI